MVIYHYVAGNEGYTGLLNLRSKNSRMLYYPFMYVRMIKVYIYTSVYGSLLMSISHVMKVVEKVVQLGL